MSIAWQKLYHTVNTIEEACNLVKQVYKDSDVCLGELFRNIEMQGLSIQEVVEAFSVLYQELENDRVCRVNVEENFFHRYHKNEKENWGMSVQSLKNTMNSQLRNKKGNLYIEPCPFYPGNDMLKEKGREINDKNCNSLPERNEVLLCDIRK